MLKKGFTITHDLKPHQLGAGLYLNRYEVYFCNFRLPINVSDNLLRMCQVILRLVNRNVLRC